MKKNMVQKAAGLMLIILFFTQMHVSAQWTKTRGPEGMNVNTFYQSGKKLFAGTSSQGAFKSTDHGVTWTAANSGIENLDVFSLISDGTFLYAGTNQGVYRSSNNGKTWSPANNGIQTQFVVSFLEANGFLFAGTVSFGLFKSNDHGNTWTDANGGALGSSSIRSICFSGSNIVTMADNLIFYSNDNGNSWFIPQNSPFVFSSNPAFIAHGDSVLLSSSSVVFQSFDAGQSWGSGITVNPDISISGLVQSGNIIYAGSSNGMFQSKNFGKTWKQIPASGLRIGSRLNHFFYKSGSNFLLGFDEIGVAYSPDKGKTWNYTLNGFTPAASIDDALFSSGSTIYSGTHSDGLYQSLNDGTSWSKIGTTNDADSLSNGIVFSVLKVNNILLAGTCSFGLFRSADNGVTWAHIRNGLPQQAGSLCVNSLTKSSTNILAGTDQGLFFSTDNGLSWHSTNISGTGFNVVGVAANDSVACAAVEGFTGPNKIYRSINKGVNWTSVFSTSTDDFTTIASDGSNHFYVGLFGSNLVSNNNGASWQNFGPGIPSGAFALGVKGSNVWAGTSAGIYFSNNNALSFTNVSTGLDPSPNNSVQGFAISSTFIFAGLFNDAVWKRPLSDFGISRLSSEVENGLNVAIAPNPVTNESMLSYHVEKASPVTIVIYDELGRTMKTLVNANAEPGDYQAVISRDELPAGNYFATVVVGSNHTAIKFLVTK